MNTEKNEILFRAGRYAKWKPLQSKQEFESTEQIGAFLRGQLNTDFLQIRIDGVECTIKMKQPIAKIA